MGVDVRCPACHTHARVPPDAVGRNMRCKKCNKPFVARPTDATIAAKGPAGPESKKRLLLFLAIGLFVLLVVILIILRVTGVF